MTDPSHNPDHSSLISYIQRCSGEQSSEFPPAPGISMSNTYLDKAIEAVPELGNRISLFTKKLRLAQYADNTIYSYRLKMSQAVLSPGCLSQLLIRYLHTIYLLIKMLSSEQQIRQKKWIWTI